MGFGGVTGGLGGVFGVGVGPPLSAPIGFGVVAHAALVGAETPAELKALTRKQ